MRRLRRGSSGAAEVSMTPMLDIVFILLIFFIVTSTFAREDAIALEAPPPDSPAGPPVSAMLISVSDQGVITVNDRLTDIGAVRASIERVKAETPDALLVIQVMPKTKVGLIALVRDAAYSAGYTEGVNLVLSRET